MQIIFLLLSLLISFSSIAADRTLNAKITHLEELERKVAKECINNPDSSSVRVKIENTTLTCPQLIVITDRLHDKIDRDIKALEACEIAPATEAERLAAASLAAAKKAGACETKSVDNQCMGQFGCTLFAISNPLTALIGGMGRLAGQKNSCLSKGLSSAQNCLASVMKGIFDSLWGLLSLIWDIGKAAVRSAGQWLGIVKKHEASSSEKLMAAQQAGPGFIRRFVSNPIKTITDMGKTMYAGIKLAAMESYGCEKWSGAKFVSRCVRPMTNWNCATCNQKMQVMCGVGGFAVGEIGTAMLTGGLAAGGKAVALSAGRAIRKAARGGKMSRMASTTIKAIPRGAEGLAAISRGSAALARGAGRALTVVEKQAIRAWNAVETSRSSRAIQQAAGAVSRSAAGQATRIALKPVTMYLEALEHAAEFGFKTVDGQLARTTTGARAVTAENRTADGARTSENNDDVVEADIPNPSAPSPAVDRTPASTGGSITVQSNAVVNTNAVRNTTTIRNSPAPTVRGRPSAPAPTGPDRSEVRTTMELNRRSGEQARDALDYQRMSSLSPTERILEAEKVLNRKLTQKEKDAILNAHEVGIAEGRGFEAYSREDKFRKGSILIRSGLTRDEAKRILDAGVAGALPNQSRVAMLASNSRVFADRKVLDLGYLSTKPDDILRLTNQARADYASAAEGFAEIARGPNGKASDFVDAAEAMAKANKMEEAVKLLKEAVTKAGDAAAAKTDMERNIERLGNQRKENTRNPELGIQEQNLRNLLATIQDNKVVVPKTAPRNIREGKFLQAQGDTNVKNMSYSSTTQAQLTTLRSEAITNFRNAGNNFAQNARTTGNADDYIAAINSYAKAYSPEARTMMDEAIRAGVSPGVIRVQLQEKVTELNELRRFNPRNTEYGVQESSYQDLLRRVDTPQTPVTPKAPETVVVKPAANSPASPTNSVPAEVKPKPVRDPASVTPREAQDLANDYRLGANGKPKDANLASQYYLRAAEENFVKEMKRKKGPRDSSNFFENRNVSSAWNESLQGNGEVAMQMIDKLAKEGKSSAINEFIWEMQEMNIYQQKSQVARQNMHKIVDKIQADYKDMLFDPQKNAVRGWKSYNGLTN